MAGLMVVLMAGILALLAEIFHFKKVLYPVVLAAIVVSLGMNVREWHSNFLWKYSDHMLIFDDRALAFSSVLLITVFLWFLMSKSYFSEEKNLVERSSLVLFSLIGAMMLVAFNNLVTLFLGIEILSIPLYVLVTSNKKDILSNEAGFKYLIMGSFASGFLLFGIALLYGTAGSFELPVIQSALSRGAVPRFAYAGIVMLLVALAFKVSLVPFHFWAPDVYEGSPIVITALMSTMVKTSVFVAVLKLFMWYLYPVYSYYADMLAGLILLSLIVANFSALRQSNIKRLLAFSSISHSSIMMLLIIADVRNASTLSALLYYTFAYSVASVAAFAVIHFVAQQREENMDILRGLMYRHPFLAISLLIALLSMAGIPVTAGFFAKYYVLSALMISPYKWMILAAILASALGVVYYLRIILVMFEKDKKSEYMPVQISSREQWALVLSVFLLILTGIYPDLVAYWFLR